MGERHGQVRSDVIASGALSHELLDAEQECDLAKEIEVGSFAQRLLATPPPGLGATAYELAELRDRGAAARERLLTCNLRLVARIARGVSYRTGQPIAELFQEGVIGLIEAIDRYDYARATRFGTWAAVMIRSRILRAAGMGCGTGNLRASQAAQARVVRRLDETGQASDAELAAQLGWTASWVGRLRDSSVREPPPEEPPDPSADAAFDAVLGRLVHGELMTQLTRLERQVLSYRLGAKAYSRAEIARLLDTAPSVVRRIEARALTTLRSALSGQQAELLGA